MAEPLRECPFCGHSAILNRDNNRVSCGSALCPPARSLAAITCDWNRRAAGEMPKEVANLVYVVREAELAFMEKQMYQEAAGLRSCRKRVESLYPRAGQEENT